MQDSTPPHGSDAGGPAPGIGPPGDSRRDHVARVTLSSLVVVATVMTLLAVRAADAVMPPRLGACRVTSVAPDWALLVMGMSLGLVLVATIWSTVRAIRRRWHIQEVAVLAPAGICLLVTAYVHYVVLSGLGELLPACPV